MTTGYGLSGRCQLSQCDAFFSHSWHDPREEKWRALSQWCREFEAQHARAPRLWFDKVCINQANITEDLECLPIFLAGCNRLLVISGETYTPTVRADQLASPRQLLVIPRNYQEFIGIPAKMLGFSKLLAS